MDLKDILKNLKTHESTISTVFGFIVIVVVGLLVVNYFRNIDRGGETFPTGANTEQAENGDSRTHTVAEGESLWTIAEAEYGDGFKWVEIAEANDLTDPDGIEEGMEIVIPADSEELAVNTNAEEEMTFSEEAVAEEEEIAAATETEELPATPEPTVEPTPEPVVAEVISETTEEAPLEVTGDTYTVQHGDNLWDIAVAAYGDGYRWTDIAEANDLVNPGVIHAGNVFTLPR